MSSSELDTVIFQKLLADRSVPAKEEYLSEKIPNAAAVAKLYDDILAIRETLGSFAKGDFDVPLTGRGVVWGHLKALQANLKHLAWQVEQVAAGDLSQRVDFMGDFSVSFNKMVLQLEQSLEEMKMREAAERVQIMFDATPLCCCFWNEQLQLLDCNLEVVNVFGLSSKQEFIERFFDLVPEYQPSGQRSLESIYESVAETFETGYYRCEFFHQTLDGEPIPAESTFVRVLQGNHYLVACYTRDLRELRRQQAAVEEQRLLLLDVISSSPVCFAILVDGKIKFSSAFMKQFLGLVLDEPFIGCFVDMDKGMDLLTKVNKEVHVAWEPVTLYSGNGELKEMLANLFPTNYYGEQGVIVWLVDITELKRTEADLRTAKESAEHLGRVKDDFIANMSHELRTPMNAFLGILHLLHGTNLSMEQTSYVGTMEESAKHLLRIINDLLDFSHLDSGKIFIGSEDFDIRQTLSQLLSPLQEAAEAKNLSLFHSVDDSVPTVVTGDPVRLQQIIASLIDNALKFTTQGGVRLSAQAEPLEGTDDKMVLWFSVQDTGIGMTTEDRERLFKPFSQVDTSGTRQYGGIGLGLATAKNLVEMMGGHIWCESEPQHGSTFFFTVTVEVPSEETMEVVFPESFRNMPILLVEDNKVNQIVATKILNTKGFQIDVAPDGLQAVKMVKQKNYALVLMDIQMPVMDGIQATCAIRSDAQYESLPIVALTANAMEEDRQRCLAAGMNDFIAKPIKPEVMFRTILKWAQCKTTKEP